MFTGTTNKLHLLFSPHRRRVEGITEYKGADHAAVSFEHVCYVSADDVPHFYDTVRRAGCKVGGCWVRSADVHRCVVCAGHDSDWLDRL